MSTAENESPRRPRPRVARPRATVAVRRGSRLGRSRRPAGRGVRARRPRRRWWPSASGTPWSRPRLAARARPVLVAAAGSSRSCVGVGQWVAEARTGATRRATRSSASGRCRPSTGRPAGLLAILRAPARGRPSGRSSCGVGQWVVVASGAWDRTPAQRGWHDKAAGTLVLRAGRVRRAATPGGAAPRRVELAPSRAPVGSRSAAPGTRPRPGLEQRRRVGLLPPVPVLATARRARARARSRRRRVRRGPPPTLPQAVATPPVAADRRRAATGGCAPTHADGLRAVGPCRASIDTPRGEPSPAARACVAPRGPRRRLSPSTRTVRRAGRDARPGRAASTRACADRRRRARRRVCGSASTPASRST